MSDQTYLTCIKLIQKSNSDTTNSNKNNTDMTLVDNANEILLRLAVKITLLTSKEIVIENC